MSSDGGPEIPDTAADGPGLPPIIPHTAADGTGSPAVFLGGNTGSVHRADPVNVATGNLCEIVRDYTTAGQNPLSLTRTYHSLTYTRNLYPTLMGVNWRTNFDRYLRLTTSILAGKCI